MKPHARESRLAGQTLADRYDLLELLGEGGMGAVYRARDRELDELVALKVIRGELARQPAMLERFRSEVKLARRVTHANVARTFELGRAGDVVFCTMELVTGESLTHRLARGPRMALAETIAVACALLDGLEAAHAAGIIHRDIKPDNVLIAESGRVVLADFGVAALAAGTGELSGTPSYMAPEQARGEPPTPACDVYSVGVVLFEMVTGRRAFAGSALEILDAKQAVERLALTGDEVPPELAAVIGRATARAAPARIATAAELRRELAPWSRGSRIPTEQPIVAASVAPTTVLVVAPPAEQDDDKLYLAEALCSAVLVQLSRAPGLRVLSRERGGESAAVVVRFQRGEQLAVRIERTDTALELRVPFAVDQIAAATRAIAHAVTSAVALPAPELSGAALEARDLALRARHNVIRGLHMAAVALEQIERAKQLAPDDPYVAAVLAIVYTRRAFFVADAPADLLVRAASSALAAVAAAPTQADAHVALGHVALHQGRAVESARHFRAAIACAPHEAEAHEYLGRILLEAGFVADALARLEAAIAISPGRFIARWDVARAFALEGRWDDYDREVDELMKHGIDREFARVRFIGWRRDTAALREMHAKAGNFGREFQTGLAEAMWDVFDGNWEKRRDQLLAVSAAGSHNKRRAAFVAQLVAELAGFAHDPASAEIAIQHGLAAGLFDLHWLDHCPLLDELRARPQFAQVRAPIKQRAEAILDAMYGDHALGTVETAVAPSAIS
ncbi:MAG TPA: protein kinase [Kofleriaceae bacterium]|jgi:serine/threonine-protein kinase